MRFGIALALLVSVIAVLIVVPAMRSLAHQFPGHCGAGPSDLKTLFHAEGNRR